MECLAEKQQNFFYGIPKSMLGDKLTGKTPMARKKGLNTYFPPHIEDRIEKWITHMVRIGYGQTCSDVLEKLEELLTKLKILNDFINN